MNEMVNYGCRWRRHRGSRRCSDTGSRRGCCGSARCHGNRGAPWRIHRAPSTLNCPGGRNRPGTDTRTNPPCWRTACPTRSVLPRPIRRCPRCIRRYLPVAISHWYTIIHSMINRDRHLHIQNWGGGWVGGGFVCFSGNFLMLFRLFGLNEVRKWRQGHTAILELNSFQC